MGLKLKGMTDMLEKLMNGEMYWPKLLPLPGMRSIGRLAPGLTEPRFCPYFGRTH